MAKHALDIEIRGDMAELNGALKELNTGLRLTNGEISAVKKELKFDPSSVELLTQQQDHLQDALVLSTKKAEALRRQLESPNVEVGSQEYVRLSTQLSTAQSAARNYDRQLQQVNGTLSGINRTGESFRLNTDSVHTFSSTLSGVNAALTRLGGFRRIEGFDTSRASAHELAQYAARVSDTLSVLTRKSEILESALEHIDPNVDVREFQRLQNALNETRDQIEALNRRRVEIPININSNQTSGAFTQLGTKLSQGISSISSVIGPPAQARWWCCNASNQCFIFRWFRPCQRCIKWDWYGRLGGVTKCGVFDGISCKIHFFSGWRCCSYSNKSAISSFRLRP